MSKDPYALKAEWLINASEEETLTFIRNRIVYAKSMGLPVDEARGEKPENFLIWVYQREDEAFREKFASALGKLLGELFEQISQGHEDRVEPLSGILHIVSKNRVVRVVKILQEKLIQDGRLSPLALRLHKREGKYSLCILHQALLTLTVLEAAMARPSERLLSQPFWESILERHDLPGFRGLAIRGLGYIDWRLGLRKLPLFIDELLEKSEEEHPDDLVLSLASALRFLFQQLIIERELQVGYSEYLHVDFIEMVAKILCVYRYKRQLRRVLDLAQTALKYLNDRREFAEKKALIEEAAKLIYYVGDAVILGTTASVVSFENEEEFETGDPLNLDFLCLVREEKEKGKVIYMGRSAITAECA